MPPPVIEFGIQENSEENRSGIDDLGPVFADSNKNAYRTEHETTDLISMLNRLPWQFEIAGPAIIGQDQHRKKYE